MVPQRLRSSVTRTCLVICGLNLWPTAASAQPAPPLPSLSLEGALARAAEHNPSVLASRRRRPVDLAGRAVAAERLNPEIRVEAERETPRTSYTFALPLELGGKRNRRIALSDATIRKGEAELAFTLLDVRAAVRVAYFERLVADARIALQRELRDLAIRVRDTARQRFDAGSAPRLELVQAELALAQVENDTATAQAASESARTQLNALLAFPLESSWTMTSSLEPGQVPPSQAAIAQATAGSLELAVMDRRMDEQRARLALALSMQVPDVTPEAALTRNSEPEFDTGWRAAVAVGVPLFTRHRAAVRVEEAALSQLQSERDAIQARVAGEVASLAGLAQSQHRQYARYRDQILPQALEVERMAEDSYELGQTGLAAFLQALQATRDVRLRALQAAADVQRTLASLERAIGAPVP